jgi:pimeloyl-ACP methyl ester carboxylesterase
MPTTHLVLLPGLDGTGLLFKPLLEALPSHLIPIVISYPKDQALGYDELLALVLKQLPKNAAYVVLGESFSGPLALRVAALQPQGLTAVILNATFITHPHRYIPLWTKHLIPYFPYSILPSLAKVSAYFGAYHSTDMHEALSTVAPEVFAHRLKQILAINVTAELVACQLPILYIQAKHDGVVPASNLEHILRLKPEVQYVQIDAPHLVLQSQPLLAAQAISAFIDKVRSLDTFNS